MANDLVVSVGGNIRDLERAMKAAGQVAAREADAIEKRFNQVNPSFSTSALTGALKGLAAAFTVDKLIRGLADANAELVRIGETAKRVGLDLQRFQELQFAGRQNGLTGKEFGTGIEGLAERLNEARQGENSLSKLLDDNNVKYKTRKGEVVGINEALGQVANLVRNAATEFDKIKIAEAAGLTRDWVPLLEQGAEAIDRQAAAAREAGVMIDSEVIRKAKDFERDWAVAVERWSTLIKSNAGAIIALIDTLIAKASGLAGMLGSALGEYSRRVQANEDLRNNGVGGASADTLRTVRDEGRRRNMDVDPAVTRRLEQLEEAEREARRGSGSPLQVTVKPRGRATTDTSSLFKKGGGGGGGSGRSDEDQAQDRLDRYIESLQRQRAVMEAEIATVGKSNAERKAAVEIAKAQVDLEKLSTAEKANYIAKLTEEVGKNEEVRASKERLEKAQQGLNDAQRFLGESAFDALDDLISRTKRAEDVALDLGKAFVKAAAQAALLGSGPLAGIFGAAGKDGALGGLAGLLFGRATGGPVNAGQPYRVGERGPETFVPTTPGKIVPTGRSGSPISVTNAPTYNVAPASGVTPEQLAAVVDRNNQQFARNLGAMLRRHDARFA